MPLNPADPIVFPGYRPVGLDGKFGRSHPELYPSLEHFYQSEKFRGADESLRKAVMSEPTPREARKLAQRNEALVRRDWAEIHVRAMACGIQMAMREHPSLARAVLFDDPLETSPYPFLDVFWGDARPGVSQNAYLRLLRSIRERINKGTVRLLATGSSTFHNRFLFQTKLEGLLKRVRPDVVLIGCRKGVDELAERWAMERLVPVRHVPLRGRGHSAQRQRLNDSLLRSSTHVVIFSQGDVASETLIEQATAASLKLRVVRADRTGRMQT